jgi:hypothetical protein
MHVVSPPHTHRFHGNVKHVLLIRHTRSSSTPPWKDVCLKCVRWSDPLRWSFFEKMFYKISWWLCWALLTNKNDCLPFFITIFSPDIDLISNLQVHSNLQKKDDFFYVNTMNNEANKHITFPHIVFFIFTLLNDVKTKQKKIILPPWDYFHILLYVTCLPTAKNQRK